MLSSVCTTVETSTYSAQKVEVILGAGSIMQCSNTFNITQRSKIDVLQRTVVEQGDEIIQDVAKSVANDLKSIFEDFKKQGEGFPETEEGQRTIQDILVRIDTLIQNESFTEIVREVLTNASAKQTIKIELAKNSLISAANCFVTQDIIIRLVTQSIVGKIYDKMFDDDIFKDFFKREYNYNKEHATPIDKSILLTTIGIYSCVLLMPILSLLLFILLWVNFPMKNIGNSNYNYPSVGKWIVSICICILIGVLALLAIYVAYPAWKKAYELPNISTSVETSTDISVGSSTSSPYDGSSTSSTSE
jgi:hypothetical protein